VVRVVAWMAGGKIHLRCILLHARLPWMVCTSITLPSIQMWRVLGPCAVWCTSPAASTSQPAAVRTLDFTSHVPCDCLGRSWLDQCAHRSAECMPETCALPVVCFQHACALQVLAVANAWFACGCRTQGLCSGSLAMFRSLLLRYHVASIVLHQRMVTHTDSALMHRVVRQPHQHTTWPCVQRLCVCGTWVALCLCGQLHME
jgi:hypothetical protein